MPYGKSGPENHFRNETAFFIGQMEVQTRVNQSVTDESTEYTAFIPSEALRVSDESLDRTERRNTGIEDTRMAFLRKRRCWECLYHVH